MNAQMLGLFSGLPTLHFPNAVVNRLKEELFVRKRLVFVSAWPSEYQRNDNDAASMHGMFEECDLPFSEYYVIDNRTEAILAKELIRTGSCIFLMGSNATQQFQLLRRKAIVDEIRSSSAVILGVSAGSINMAKHSVDIWESLTPYDGLDLVDITIKAHFDMKNKELVQTLKQVSMELPICAMEDDSAIFVKDGYASLTGRIYRIHNRKITVLSQEMLESIANR